MRWAQVAFTEDDPGNYDPKFWFDYFRRIHADAVCLSAGGVVAFYPTKIPLHYRSKYLGNRDPFGEMVAGCRELGMNVVARTDPHACTEEAFRKHPEWVAREGSGQPRRHWAAKDLYVTCALGPFNFEFMTEVTREIVSLYKVDGVFSNRWAGHGTCYCASCLKLFREFSGLDLPRTADPKDPARRQYIVWEQKRLFELWKLWDAEIRKINPGACFIANSGGGALSELDMKTVGELSSILFADRQARRGLMPPWANGKNGKEYRAAMGRKPIGGIFSVGVEESYRWKDSVQSDAEIRVWAADGIAQGLRPWFTKFNAKPIDPRWMKTVEGIYKWHWQHEKYFRNEENLARAAVVYSQQTAWFYGGEKARERVEDHQLGVYQALVESRIPFEMVHDGLLDGAHVDRYNVLILPNIAALSEAQCKQLEGYVQRGGSLVATHETSLYDEWGDRRKDFGLARLFGCSFDGTVEERIQNSYLTIERGQPVHPLLAGMEETPRVINAVKRVHVRQQDKRARTPLTLVPSYPDLPMEMVYATTPRTDIPMAFCREFGKGRVVYFPMDIDRTFWEVLSPDHLTLLRNAVRWAAKEEPLLRVEGPGLIDIALWRQKNSVAAHIVNLTNPMTMKGPFRELIPVGPLEIHCRLPKRFTTGKAHLLTANQAVEMKQNGDSVSVTVPRVELHEVVVFDGV
ncbi:MAG: ThuA domain-containing protein [Bryobacteraceae bacterium]|nr:ThuA domain-containing protein [Bryobacteraceae bacterium]